MSQATYQKHEKHENENGVPKSFVNALFGYRVWSVRNMAPFLSPKFTVSLAGGVGSCDHQFPWDEVVGAQWTIVACLPRRPVRPCPSTRCSTLVDHTSTKACSVHSAAPSAVGALSKGQQHPQMPTGPSQWISYLRGNAWRRSSPKPGVGACLAQKQSQCNPGPTLPVQCAGPLAPTSMASCSDVAMPRASCGTLLPPPSLQEQKKCKRHLTGGGGGSGGEKWRNFPPGEIFAARDLGFFLVRVAGEYCPLRHVVWCTRQNVVISNVQNRPSIVVP